MGKHKKNHQRFDLSFDTRFLVLGVVILFAVIIAVDTENKVLPPLGLNIGYAPESGMGSTAPTMAVQPHKYSGSIDIIINHRDALDFTENRIEGKDLITTFYKRNSNGDYLLMGSGNFNGLHVNDYKLYFTVETNATDLYISPAHTADWEINPRILSFDFFDIDHDYQSEWVFEYDISGIDSDPTGRPTFAIYTMSIDEATATLTSPSDIDVYPNDSITNINWDLDIPEETGTAIKRVELFFDNTDSSLFEIYGSYVRIPYIDNIELQEMDKTMLANGIIYSYDFGKDLGDSGYVFTDRDGNTSHDMTTRIHTHLSEGDELGLTLKVTLITPDSASKTIEDKVTLFATFDADPNTQQILDLAEDMEFDQIKIGYKIKCENDYCELDATGYPMNSTKTNVIWNYTVKRVD